MRQWGMPTAARSQCPPGDIAKLARSVGEHAASARFVRLGAPFTTFSHQDHGGEEVGVGNDDLSPVLSPQLRGADLDVLHLSPLSGVFNFIADPKGGAQKEN